MSVHLMTLDRNGQNTRKVFSFQIGHRLSVAMNLGDVKNYQQITFMGHSINLLIVSIINLGK